MDEARPSFISLYDGELGSVGAYEVVPANPTNNLGETSSKTKSSSQSLISLRTHQVEIGMQQGENISPHTQPQPSNHLSKSKVTKNNDEHELTVGQQTRDVQLSPTPVVDLTPTTLNIIHENHTNGNSSSVAAAGRSHGRGQTACGRNSLIAVVIT